MTQRIPNLWSEKDVKVEVLSPLAILQTQAANLETMTKGLIEAEITTLTNERGETLYNLDLVAPALGGYRHRLFGISHKQDMVYPVKFILPSSQNFGSMFPFASQLSAETEAEFLEKLGEVLQSNSVNAVIQSLIARSNEVQSVGNEAKTVTEAVA